MKASEKSLNWRVVLGALILVAVIVVIGLKAIQGKTAVAAATSATTPGSAPAGSVNAMPSDPVAQLNWVEEHKVPAMVIYRSTSCVPCIAMGKLIEQVRADYEPQVAFVSVLTDDPANAPLVRQAGIQAIPTSFFVRADAQTVTVLGAMEESALRTQLEALKIGQ